METTSYSVGLFIGLFIGIMFAVIAVRFMRKDRKLKGDYDERQELIRGKAYKYGFFVGMIGNALVMVSYSFLVKYVNAMLLVFGVILLSVLVYAVYCIMYDAYFALNDNPRNFMMISAGIGILNFFIGGITVVKEHPALNSVDMPDGYMNLLCGGMFIIIFFALLIKKISSKQES